MQRMEAALWGEATTACTPPPSRCTIRGLHIEELEPHLNFRRGFTLKYTDNEEDRMHVLPYFRAVQDGQMATR